MKYNFDKVINRNNTNSLKWDVSEGELPLWVADMDFETAPCIKAALEKKVQHGIFGYSIIPDAWAESYVNWWKTRHNLNASADWLVFSSGVVPSLSTLVRKLTTPGEKVLIQTPCYNIFVNSIVNNGRFVKENQLKYDAETVSYSIDFEQLDKDLSDPQVSLLIITNPQNPTGNIWTKEELGRIGELCKKHNVTVISDEIHCDIAKPGVSYIPFASVSDLCREISITLVAPSKCFNIAGIQSSAMIIPNPVLRHKAWRSINTDECGEPNIFAVEAAMTAFNEGGDWLDELNEYIWGNRKYAEEFFAKELPGYSVVKGMATYLLWVDVHCDGDDFASQLRKDTGLFINGGNEYGGTGTHFVRINMACPRSTLEDALNRFKKFADSRN